MTNKVFGWGLIGCGGAGRAHARYAAADTDVAVRAFCDVDAGNADRLAAEHDGAVHTTDPSRLLEDPEIDIVAIATAHDSHSDLAVAAFECRRLPAHRGGAQGQRVSAAAELLHTLFRRGPCDS